MSLLNNVEYFTGKATKETKINRLYALLDNFPGRISVIDKNYRIYFANKRYIDEYGSWVGRHCYELTNGCTKPCKNCRTFQNGKVIKEYICYEQEKRDGRIFEIHDYPYQDADNTQLVVKIAIDITEKKQLQEKLLQLERLRVIEKLAAELAHEIRNPLTTVRGFLQLMLEERKMSRYSEYLPLMIEELDKINLIISDLIGLTNVAGDIRNL